MKRFVFSHDKCGQTLSTYNDLTYNVVLAFLTMTIDIFSLVRLWSLRNVSTYLNYTQPAHSVNPRSISRKPRRLPVDQIARDLGSYRCVISTKLDYLIAMANVALKWISQYFNRRLFLTIKTDSAKIYYGSFCNFILLEGKCQEAFEQCLLEFFRKKNSAPNLGEVKMQV